MIGFVLLAFVIAVPSQSYGLPYEYHQMAVPPHGDRTKTRTIVCVLWRQFSACRSGSIGCGMDCGNHEANCF